MPQIVSLVTRKAAEVFRAPGGIPLAVEQIADAEDLSPDQFPVPKIAEQNIATDTLEKKIGAQYPSLHVFCERLDNRLTEKFRTFSGIARMVAEVRVSQDHIDNIENLTRLYVDAVTQVLGFNRGDWSGGMFYGGGYEVIFAAVKHGGKNYLQSARVNFVVNVSVD